MYVHGEVDVWFQLFLSSALDGNRRSFSPPAAEFPKESASGTHYIGCYVGLRANRVEVNPAALRWEYQNESFASVRDRIKFPEFSSPEPGPSTYFTIPAR
jgi:hypothetical protein